LALALAGALALAFPSGAAADRCGAGQIDRGGRCTSFAQAERRILAIARQEKKENDLKAVILRVDVGGRKLAETAMGDSMSGSRASTRMHFRSGSIAISYLTTILLQLEDEGRISLDDKLSKWLPKLPRASQITLRMLAGSTSGYFDFAQGNPAFDQLFVANVFRQWKPSELLNLAFARGFACDPGTCFHYAHTNFVILGEVLRKVTGKSVATLMRRRILGPLGLGHTHISSFPDIPRPVLHAYNQRASGDPYEDSTFWNPSWAVGPGVLQTSTIDDVARSAPAIGTGRLISRRAHREQLAPPAFVPAGSVPKFYYGLGVVMSNSWLVQNPLFNGYIGLMAYLPSKRISIAIESTVGPANPESAHYSAEIFDQIGAYLAPDRPPGVPSA
jgi:D-alanyl-D-alanine carboxypeptidase